MLRAPSSSRRSVTSVSVRSEPVTGTPLLSSSSASEFIENAIKFYAGYLKQQGNVNYLAPIITDSVNGIVVGSERRLNRNLFKIAVELGKLSHMMAALNDVDDETLKDLHAMCVNEVRRINGTIDFDDAVRFQNDT